MARRNWVVSFASDEAESDLIFGPYTQARAEALVASLQPHIERAVASGNYAYANATCYPLQNPGITELRHELGLD